MTPPPLRDLDRSVAPYGTPAGEGSYPGTGEAARLGSGAEVADPHGLPRPATPTPGRALATTGRVDSFTDAVLAIVVTLMAVELAPPDPDAVDRLGLWGALIRDWPSYLAFAVSFALVGQVWLSHHAMWAWIGRVDRALVVLQLAHLLFVSLVPLAARLLADHLTGPAAAARTGAAVYAGVALAEGASFNAVWAWARRNGLTVPELDRPLARAMTLRFGSGVPLYALALALAFVSPWLSLAVYVALVGYFLVPGPGEERGPTGPVRANSGTVTSAQPIGEG